MSRLASDRRTTTVRSIEIGDIDGLMRMIDLATRIHLRLSPPELRARLSGVPGVVAEDRVGLRGFMIIEPQPPEMAIIIAAGLRDSWRVEPYLDLLLPTLEQTALEADVPALVFIGNVLWLVDDLVQRGFEAREWVIVFERLGADPPKKPALAPAQIRVAHTHDLAALSVLDDLAFAHIWHKSMGNLREALALAASFAVAVVDGRVVAYEWCELYGQHAHLTRLAVHPDYQGRGIGAQLLYRAIIDVLAKGANLITLNTQENNRRSQALYQRFGFVDTQERVPVMWKSLRAS